MKRLVSFFLTGALLFPLGLSAHAEFYNDPFRSVSDGALSLKTAKKFSFESITADGFTQTLNYRLYLPDGYDENKVYPVVIFLHGYGERDDGSNTNVAQLNIGMMSQFFNKGFAKDFPCILLAPQCPKNSQWAVQGYKGSYTIYDKENTDTFTQAIRLCKLALDKTAEQYRVDPDRVYVTGLSMGGYGTWNIITHYPDYFAAAAPICGGGDPKRAESLVDIPVWCFHGDKDPTVPVSGSRDMYHAITEAGGEKINYTEWAGGDHYVWSATYARRDLWEWMFSQKKTTVDASSLQSKLESVKKLDPSALSDEKKAFFDSAVAYAEEVLSSPCTPAMKESAETMLDQAAKSVKTRRTLPFLVGGGAVAVAAATAGTVFGVKKKKAKRQDG